MFHYFCRGVNQTSLRNAITCLNVSTSCVQYVTLHMFPSARVCSRSAVEEEEEEGEGEEGDWVD